MFIFVISFLVKELCVSQEKWTEAKWKVVTKTTFQYLIFKKTLNSQSITNNSAIDDSDMHSYEADIPNSSNLLTIDVETSINLYWGFLEFVCAVI